MIPLGVDWHKRPPPADRVQFGPSEMETEDEDILSPVTIPKPEPEKRTKII